MERLERPQAHLRQRIERVCFVPIADLELTKEPASPSVPNHLRPHHRICVTSTVIASRFDQGAPLCFGERGLIALNTE